MSKRPQHLDPRPNQPIRFHTIAGQWGQRLCLVLLLLSMPCPLVAGPLDDIAAILAELDRPRSAWQTTALDISLPLAAGRLDWERGRCRILRLPAGQDSLFIIELSGKGRLRLNFTDSLERLAVETGLGRQPLAKRLRRVTLVVPALPTTLAGRTWRPAKPLLPFLHVPDFHGREKLSRLQPDNPLLWRLLQGLVDDPEIPRRASADPGPQWLWLTTDPGEWVWEERGDVARLRQPLHGGSSIEVPVTELRRRQGDQAGALWSSVHPWAGPLDASWLAPTLSTPPTGVDSMHLSLARHGEAVDWELGVSMHAAAPLLCLLLDAHAVLRRAEWTTSSGALPARGTRDLAGAKAGPWLVLEVPDDQQPLQLRLAGRSARALQVRIAPGQRRAGVANWFPRLPWWESPRPIFVSDPDSLLPVNVSEARPPLQLGSSAPQILLPEERPPLPLSGDVSLCWTPLRERASFHVPQPASVRRLTADIANLDLPRERLVRPPSHEDPAEPIDLTRGRDTLAIGMLGEDLVLAELVAATARLHSWLGRPPRNVLLLERVGARRDRREEEDQLIAHDLPPELPIEIQARDLRDASPAARLARLEALCRGWWEPPTAEAAVAPRWICWGAARACALLLVEEEAGEATAGDLRTAALDRQLNLFRANSSSSLLAMGERAEGRWRSAEVQNGLAWRFALLLEHLRWRMRDPLTLDDGLYRDFLRDMMTRLREPVHPRAPLRELSAIVTDFLVANDLLERSGFGDVVTARTWLGDQWVRSSPPSLRVATGQVERNGVPELVLRVAWVDPPPPGTVLPVLAHTAEGYSAWSLRATTREEQFVLPLDPRDLLGLEVAPGASLPARIRVE